MCKLKYQLTVHVGESGKWLIPRTLTVTVVHTSCESNSRCRRCLYIGTVWLWPPHLLLPLTFQAQLFSVLLCSALISSVLTAPPLLSSPLFSSLSFSSPLRQQSEWQPFLQPSLEMQTTKIASVVLRSGDRLWWQWLMQKIFDKIRIWHHFDACCLSWGTSVLKSHI